MRLARSLIVVLGSAAALVPAAAQGPVSALGRSAFSISFSQSRPLGGLRQNIGFGYGGNVAYLFRLDETGALSLRGDLGFLGYGSEEYDTPLSSTIGGRIIVRVRTTNNIVPMAIGPQVTWPTGPIRPYGNVGIAGQYFYTQSSVRDPDEEEDIASTTNQWDWTGAWVAGGGVYIPLSTKRLTVSADLGIQYYNGGHAQYLRPGSIEDLPDGDILITPLESETRLALVRVGIRIGF